MEEAESKVFPITKFNFGGRINKSAVRGVLARVCLFNAGFPCYNTERYKDAYKWAKMVIDDPAHSLIPNLQKHSFRLFRTSMIYVKSMGDRSVL